MELRPEQQRAVLLGGLAVVVVLLFGVGVLATDGSTGRVGDDPPGWVEGLDGLLGGLPGLSNDLDADDVPAALDCRVGDRLAVSSADASGGCSFVIPDDVDRVALRRLAGTCRIELVGQRGVADQRVVLGGADDTARMAITGDGPEPGRDLQLTVEAVGSTCRLSFD